MRLIAHGLQEHLDLANSPILSSYLFVYISVRTRFHVRTESATSIYNMRDLPMCARCGYGGSGKQEQILPVDNATIPYWRTEPHALDEHRTTESLPPSCDIAIIGAGMSGIATAYHISKLSGNKATSIVVLEARQLCSGATGRNGVGSIPCRRQRRSLTIYRATAKCKRHLCNR